MVLFVKQDPELEKNDTRNEPLKHGKCQNVSHCIFFLLLYHSSIRQCCCIVVDHLRHCDHAVLAALRSPRQGSYLGKCLIGYKLLPVAGLVETCQSPGV